jgi:hypothetical protein
MTVYYEYVAGADNHVHMCSDVKAETEQSVCWVL